MPVRDEGLSLGERALRLMRQSPEVHAGVGGPDPGSEGGGAGGLDSI